MPPDYRTPAEIFHTGEGGDTCRLRRLLRWATITTVAKVHMHQKRFSVRLDWFVQEDDPKVMTLDHYECLNYASENDYTQVRYAQGDWRTRDPELVLYLEVPGKPTVVAVGLTERAVRCLRELGDLHWEMRDTPPTISRAGTMMRAAAGKDDIPCCAFVPGRRCS